MGLHSAIFGLVLLAATAGTGLGAAAAAARDVDVTTAVSPSGSYRGACPEDLVFTETIVTKGWTPAQLADLTYRFRRDIVSPRDPASGLLSLLPYALGTNARTARDTRTFASSTTGWEALEFAAPGFTKQTSKTPFSVTCLSGKS